MKRTKRWWNMLNKEERAELCRLERFNRKDLGDWHQERLKYLIEKGNQIYFSFLCDAVKQKTQKYKDYYVKFGIDYETGEWLPQYKNRHVNINKGKVY